MIIRIYEKELSLELKNLVIIYLNIKIYLYKN